MPNNWELKQILKPWTKADTLANVNAALNIIWGHVSKSGTE